MTIDFKKGLTQNKIFFIFFIFSILLIWYNDNNAFFWDTLTLGSRQALWFYDNNFRYFFLPPELDAMHIPLFGMLLALWWKITAKTLILSHWFMAFFVVLSVWELKKLWNIISGRKYEFFVLLILFFDATFLAQSSQVSVDIVMLCTFIMAINGILTKNVYKTGIACLVLSLLSIRGIFAVGAIFFSDFYFDYKDKRYFNLKLFFKYIPVFISLTAYFTFKFITLGYIKPEENNSWSTHYEFNDFFGIIKHIIVIIWQTIDYGRVFLYLFLFIAVFYLIRKERKINIIIKKIKNILQPAEKLIFISILFILMQLPFMLLYKQPVSHRYLMLIYPVLAIIIIYFLTRVFNREHLKIYLVLLFLLQASGCFWVYPEKIAQGWNCTPKHWTYFNLRKQMIAYMQNEKIPIEETGTSFPNNISFKYIDLNGENISFADKDLASQKYIFYSNIFNDFTDWEIDNLHQNWIIKKEFKSWLVFVRLYEKKE